jgi:type VI secretion system secreted protein VgrG
MPDETRPLGFETKAGGVEPFLLSALAGAEAISRPYEFQLELLSKQGDVKLEDMVRNPAAVTMKVPVAGGDKRRMKTVKIHGVLSTFEQLDKAHEWVKYRAVLVPRLWKLSLSVQSRIYLDKDVKGVVKEVLEADVAGKKRFTSKDYEFKTSKSYPKREYVVQYQETDLDFLSRWLEHEGIFYFFEQTEEGEKLVFADDTSAYLKLAGDPKIPYRPTSAGGSVAPGVESGETVSEESLRSFVGRQQEIPAKVVLREYNYRTPAADLKAEATTDSKDDGEVYEFGSHFKDEGEGKALAKVRAEEILCRQKVFLGKSDCRSFRAGVKFPVSEHYRPDFNGGAGYLITSVRHKAQQAISPTGSPGALTYENEFEAIPADRTYRPPRRTPWPKISGVWNAKVDAAGDGKYAELDADGRYSVKLFLDRSDRKDGKASRLIRMAQPYGGAGMGFHFPLHKKTEVLLAHADGDPDRPVILASVPNPETASLVAGPNQTQCELKSGGNNEIRFEDQEGSEQIYLHAQKDRLTVVENNETKQVKNDQVIEVTSNRNKTVSGNQTEHVVKDKTITVDQNHTETVTQNMSVTVGQNESLTVGQNRTVAVGANQEATVGASKVETVAANRTDTVGAAMSLTIGATYAVTVGGAMNEAVAGAKAMEIGGAYGEVVAGDKSETVGGNRTEAVADDHSTVVGKNCKLKAKKILIEAEDEITLKTGSATIVMKKNGDIKIDGKNIQAKGSGDIVMKGQKIKEN